jgi:type I pantothenate kinase
MDERICVTFDRAAWAARGGGDVAPLSAVDVAALSGIEEALSIREVEQIYLPLAQLLHELAREAAAKPYVIAIGGSVSAGKSTTARVLQTLLARSSGAPRVDLVPTDGFLFPNAELENRRLMQRKGFPESYDMPRLLAFVTELKSGAAPLCVPVYSHLRYDIVKGEEQVIDRPDIAILEGLTVLQIRSTDFSIYVDASENDLEAWFLARFRKLRETAFRDPASFFHPYATKPEEEAMAMARWAWQQINLVNLRENILPTRELARLVVRKGAGHAVEEIRLCS